MATQYFTWRYHVVECLRSGHLPLWNAYNLAGYPLHADPQSGAWYLPLWLLAAFGRYNPMLNGIEFLLHIVVGAMGLYALVNFAVKNQSVALLCGIAYIGNGLFVGNAQHFTYVIAAAWLPWVLLYFVKLITAPNWQRLCGFVLFYWLFFTGGYTAFFIVSVYLLASIALYALIKKHTTWQTLFTYLPVAVILFTLLSAPLLYSVYLYADKITRTNNGVQLAQVLFGHFRPKDLISLLVPQLSAARQNYGLADLSMINAYAGLLVVPGVFMALLNFRAIPTYLKATAIASLVFMLLSFGGLSPIPLREWFFYVLPGFDLFRFPALFRLFFIVGLILLSAWGLQQGKGLKLSLGLTMGIAVVAAIPLLINNPLQSLAVFTEQPPWATAAFYGLLIQLPLWGLLYFKPIYKYAWVVVLANTVLATQFNLFTSVVAKENPQAMMDYCEAVPLFNQPINPRYSPTQTPPVIMPVWANVGTIPKLPTFEGYNNFRLSNYDEYIDSAKARYANRPFAFITTVNNEVVPCEVTFNTPNKFTVKPPADGVLTIQHNLRYYWQCHNTKGNLLELNFDGFCATKKAGGVPLTFTYNPPYIKLSLILSALVLAVLLVFASMHKLKRQ